MNLFLQRISELQGNDSVSSFARRIGVPQKTLDHLVKGERKPSVDVILALAKSCNVSSDWLLGLSKTQGTPTVNAGSGAAAGELGHDWLPACMIARWTAFRYGDVATLRRSEVDLAAGVIRRTPSKTARHAIEVVIPIAAQLRPVLEELMARPVRDDMDEYLLREHACSCTASTWHRQAVRFSAVLERAGVDPRTHTFHTWRHTLRTRMAEGSVDMATAKEICGHRTDAMSAHYDHDQHLDAKRAAIEAAV